MLGLNRSGVVVVIRDKMLKVKRVWLQQGGPFSVSNEAFDRLFWLSSNEFGLLLPY